MNEQEQAIVSALTRLEEAWQDGLILVVDPSKPFELTLARTETACTMDYGKVPANDWSGQTLDSECKLRTFTIKTQVGRWHK